MTESIIQRSLMFKKTGSYDVDDYISKYLDIYLQQSKEIQKKTEYEIRFGHEYGEHAYMINHTEYENTIRVLKSSGYQIEDGDHTLKIGINKNDVNRIEIQGIHAIREYCEEEHIFGVSNKDAITYTVKKPIENIKPYDYSDYGFRVDLKEDKEVREIQSDNWSNELKTFRMVSRIHAFHPDKPNIRIDLSVVKSSTQKKSTTFKDSGVLNSKKNYSIEIEYVSNKLSTVNELSKQVQQIKSSITDILRGIQDNRFPVKYDELKNVGNEYIKLIDTQNDIPISSAFQTQLKRLYTKYFIGPSSVSLEKRHVTETNPVNIIQQYNVTDKADGDRKLLYISDSGRIYLLSTGMKFEFVGLQCDQYRNTLLDGEHIMYDKDGAVYNVYMVFDVYFVKKKDYRSLPFYIENDKNNRSTILDNLIKNMNIDKLFPHENPLKIDMKRFYMGESIFKCSHDILKQIDSNTIQYNTDGLIFTPSNTGVGVEVGEKAFNKRITWDKSFKWKPPEANTIDFLARFTKKNNVHEVKVKNGKEYKTIILHVGYDENNPEHGYSQPCKDVLVDRNMFQYKYGSSYKATPFKPTNPSDSNAMYCRLYCDMDGYVKTEDNHIIQDDTIIECRYEETKENGWRWIPIRVRHDKTSEYRNGVKKFGNDYKVANNVWHCINHPVKKSMIIGEEKVEIGDVNDDLYYNRTELNTTTELRDFHNKYVKKKLIDSVSHENDILLDLAVGKAGDLYKWIHSKLRFVMGIDLFEDNIHNRSDGACARYLNAKRYNKNIPKAIFLQGNSSLSLRNGEASDSNKNNNIIQTIFGQTKPENTQEKTVVAMQGVAKHGFNIVSCQFAIHYMFKDKQTLEGFLLNVSECCALNGYFIGTTYDGVSVFEMLRNKTIGESLYGDIENTRVWEIRKQYEDDEFEPEESSLGYQIDVYQQSINQMFPEYLVHFEYLKKLLFEYGFEIPTEEEIQKLGLQQPTGLFANLFEEMKRDTKYKIGKALELVKDPVQKKISFLNRYFVFKKVRNYIGVKSSPTMKISERKNKNNIQQLLRSNHTERLYYAFDQIASSTEFSSDLFKTYLKQILNEKGDDIISDFEIYHSYLELNNTKKKYSLDRGTRRSAKIAKLLKNNKKLNIETFLDYGCGNGEFTKSISTTLKLNPENVHCADIIEYPSIHELQFTKIQNNIVALPDNYFDLITVFMVLHHIQEEFQITAIRELYRMLKPGGILIIREHDSPIRQKEKEEFKQVLDVVHDIYDYIIDSEISWKNKEEYYSNYKSVKEWDNLMINAGFIKYEKQDRFNRNIETNSQRTYYRLFTK
jgi:ubiquinone/menaquinone biosynthesis C-methylase UbiE